MSTEKIPTGEELADALRRITHVLRRYAGAPYAKRGWPTAQVQLLLMVDLLGDRPRMGEVKRRLGVTGRAITSAVDALERDGLLRREPDPTDRRASLLAITDAGRRRLAEIERIQRGHADETFSVLDENERKTLLELLSRLEEHVAARA
ncbi:MAG TPA: MarR family transcriptional regulator [Amycolatopsis sp.]|uniref:MarR family transcriptional regulator n=1 Tax=Amycolatopsis nalaikhensis TaxID=715472 RepID=A0ABY8XRY9_9PSEU|nr:MarR family transcriptional regulator [Amycolatopsis sp. 2-2]WIV58287.1 MarR family transcriptional regulator [Amycolatopsis sp. 2-2]